MARHQPPTKHRRPKPTTTRTRARAPRGPTQTLADAPVVGSSLRQARLDRGLSLERLSRMAGVSRAMLSQVELGQSVPTITVLWKVATALGVPFSTLLGGERKPNATYLPRGQTRVLVSQDGAMSSRALYPLDQARAVEFYEVRVKPLSEEQSEAHAEGTVENLVVATGTIELTVGSEKSRLSAGDAALYQADQSHTYRNLSHAEALLYVVIGYASPP